jgi:transcriptional regulator with XRE-family HTH domain
MKNQVSEAMAKAIHRTCKAPSLFEERTGISNMKLSTWRNGFAAPTAADCEIMASAFGLSADELFPDWRSWASGQKKEAGNES